MPPFFTAAFGALKGTRTPDLLIRSQTLYPAELPAHALKARYILPSKLLIVKAFLKKVF